MREDYIYNEVLKHLRRHNSSLAEQFSNLEAEFMNNDYIGVLNAGDCKFDVEALQFVML